MIKWLAFTLGLSCNFSLAQIFVSTGTYHVRNNDPREWSSFSEEADKELLVTFAAERNASQQTLRLRQSDVKQGWHVLLNDKEIGSLVVDEKDITTYFVIPRGGLRDGDNLLQIKCSDLAADDIYIKQLYIDPRPLEDILTESLIDLTITEKGTKAQIPSRITIVNDKGSLQTVKAAEKGLVVRPGYVYTANGKAAFSLPAGKYTVYASRGFEYGIAREKIDVKPNHRIPRRLTISREVDTRGWVSADPHVHTFTHSGHGDATDAERVITLAGEGIELPIITDHNVNIDLAAVADREGVSGWFTLVTGDEVTTSIGHFNVFPTTPGPPVIDHKTTDWQKLDSTIHDVSPDPVIILNHARDVHNGFRPSDSAGVSKSAKWKLPANAMEILNSGSQQSDILQLSMDWLRLMNEGIVLTPVGSSDSHDVSRFTVGQGRTYIQCDDTDPGHININDAIASFRQGKVMVSAGLLTRITVENRYGPGDSLTFKNQVRVDVSVEGPSWVNADKVLLFSNGKQIAERPIKPTSRSVKWSGSFIANIPDRGAHLVAIALGPGRGMPWWPIAKPYQPTSPEWTPKLIGVSGAVRVSGKE